MPISFDDEQMAQIMSAAMPLPVAQAQIERHESGRAHMSEQWKARVAAARRGGYICAGCERYLLLMLEYPGGVFFHDTDGPMAERLKVDAKTLGRWRREAKAADLIATNIGTLTLVEGAPRRGAARRQRPEYAR